MWAASLSFSTAICGDGMSGLPKPRSTTSTPAARASIVRLLMIVNTYGGRLVLRRNSMTQTVPAPSAAGLVITREDGGVKPPRDGCVHVVIEIPRGSRNKYEIDHETGRVFLDR